MFLKQIHPNLSSKLVFDESPDLQAIDKSMGIEITEAVAPPKAQIDGEFAKFRFGKKLANEKEKCKKKIEKNGGEIDEIGLTYPVVNSKDEWTVFSNALKRKIKKLPSYKEKGFNMVGLFIFYNEPPIPFNPEVHLKKFAEIQSNSSAQYDFLFFGYHNGLIHYDFQKMCYTTYVIEQNIFDYMSFNARKIVEQ